jgi:hypothetical protein
MDSDFPGEPLGLPRDIIDVRVMALLQSSRACCLWRHDECDATNNPIHISVTMNDLDPKQCDGTLLVWHHRYFCCYHFTDYFMFIYIFDLLFYTVYSEDSLSTFIFGVTRAMSLQRANVHS